MGNRFKGAPAIAAALALALVAGCSPSPDDKDQAAATAPPNLRLTKAQLGHIHLYSVVRVGYRQIIQAPGTVDFDNDQSTSIVSPFTGPVTRILVTLGEHVTKGQPLALVQSADYATAVGAYRKSVVTAANAQRIAVADRDLAAHEGISEREAEQAKADAASAAADRDAALQALISMGVDRGTIARGGKASLAGTIRAPVSGIVVTKDITPGQFLQAGSSPAFTVANLSRVWVLAQISPSDLASVGAHDAATIIAGNGIGPIRGTVENIGAAVDPDTRAVIARIGVPNPGGLLKKQMYVDVAIESGRVSTGLLVPVSAVLRDDENLPFVFVAMPDGSFVRHQVTLGHRDSRTYDITSGLASGDRIVADGALFLQFMQSQ
jgi:cobalt-zinc-cadmium efflux system membrane fusion protein